MRSERQRGSKVTHLNVCKPNRELLTHPIKWLFLIDGHTTRFNLTSTGMARIKKQIITRVGQDVEKLEPETLLLGTSNSTTTVENSLAAPQKVSMESPHEPALPKCVCVCVCVPQKK